MLSDPEHDTEIIESMLNKYNLINSSFNSHYTNADTGLFREFISETFHDLKKEFKCQNIIYTIQENSGIAEIHASAEG